MPIDLTRAEEQDWFRDEDRQSLHYTAMRGDSERIEQIKSTLVGPLSDEVKPHLSADKRDEFASFTEQDYQLIARALLYFSDDDQFRSLLDDAEGNAASQGVAGKAFAQAYIQEATTLFISRVNSLKIRLIGKYVAGIRTTESSDPDDPPFGPSESQARFEDLIAKLTEDGIERIKLAS